MKTSAPCTPSLTLPRRKRATGEGTPTRRQTSCVAPRPVPPNPQRVTYLLLLALLSGCATKPPPAPTAIASAEPLEVVAAVVRREQGVRTLRARFHAVVNAGEQEHNASGVLVVSKPDRFRMRLFSPFGLTVFDYVQIADRSWVSQPLRQRAPGERDDSLAMFSQDGMGAVFLSRYAFAREACQANARVVVCRENDRVVTFDLDHQVIQSERRQLSDQGEITIAYSDHRVVDGMPLPFLIVVSTARVRVEVRIDAYEVNPELSPEIFAPPAKSAVSARSSSVHLG